MHYSIEKDEWRDEPELTDPRYNHSSCCLGAYVYVFGGQRAYDDHLSTVECLMFGFGEPWQVIAENSLARREAPALAVLNTHQIACFGGQGSKYKALDDGFVLDMRDNSI